MEKLVEIARENGSQRNELETTANTYMLDIANVTPPVFSTV